MNNQILHILIPINLIQINNNIMDLIIINKLIKCNQFNQFNQVFKINLIFFRNFHIGSKIISKFGINHNTINRISKIICKYGINRNTISKITNINRIIKVKSFRKIKTDQSNKTNYKRYF